MQEMSKQVWFFAMVLSAGVGAICFIGSLSFLLWIHLIARHLKSKVSMIKLFFLSFFSLSISLFLLLLGSYFDVLIHNNAHSIAKFMRFGFEVTPFPIEMAINFVIVFFAMLLLQVSMYVAALPFKAKRHATEIKAKTNRP
ncbi:hypothetical protein [Pseudoalteromonas porphyrae]|uniref:hypothetical protein n=1 Tax=Pseudoalteromonas porphyrae TaxID=187330 RepID=UPI00128F7C17|nr:hypothetical protein [Pseudoalteromonas porphyrae]